MKQSGSEPLAGAVVERSPRTTTTGPLTRERDRYDPFAWVASRSVCDDPDGAVLAGRLIERPTDELVVATGSGVVDHPPRRELESAGTLTEPAKSRTSSRPTPIDRRSGCGPMSKMIDLEVGGDGHGDPAVADAADPGEVDAAPACPAPRRRRTDRRTITVDGIDGALLGDLVQSAGLVDDGHSDRRLTRVDRARQLDDDRAVRWPGSAESHRRRWCRRRPGSPRHPGSSRRSRPCRRRRCT